MCIRRINHLFYNYKRINQFCRFCDWFQYIYLNQSLYFLWNASWRCTGTFLGQCVTGTALGFNLSLEGSPGNFPRTWKTSAYVDSTFSWVNGISAIESEGLLQPILKEIPVSPDSAICWMLAQFIWDLSSVEGWRLSSPCGTEWSNTPSMDVTEWQNTPSVDGTECPEWPGELFGLVSCTPWGLFCSIAALVGTFSGVKHFLRIPIKNVVSLDRTFGVSMPMTSILTLYLGPFHLRKHLKEPIGLTNCLSKFCNKKVDSSNSTLRNSLSKVCLLIALAPAPVSAIRGSFLSMERGVNP